MSKKTEDEKRNLCSVCHQWRGQGLRATTIYGESISVCSRCLIERSEERNVFFIRKALERGKAKAW